MSARIEDLEPITLALCQAFLDKAAAAGLELRITQTLRTMDQQAKLYAQGRTLPGPIVTKARPGQSAHNFGMAFDICFAGKKPYPPEHDPRWSQAGEIGKSVGLVWGGSWRGFKDRPHFEHPLWKQRTGGPL